MLKTTLLVFCTLITTHLYADESSHKNAALKLLEATHTASMLDNMTGQVTGMFSSLQQRPNLTPSQKKTIQTYQLKAVDLVKGQLSWDKVKGDFAQLYMSAYSEAELAELTRFYESELGQKMLSKTPELMAKSMSIPQKHLTPLQPQMQQLMMEMSKELSLQNSASGNTMKR